MSSGAVVSALAAQALRVVLQARARPAQRVCPELLKELPVEPRGVCALNRGESGLCSGSAHL